MSSNMSTSKVNPLAIKTVSHVVNLNDPIQARLAENKLTIKILNYGLGEIEYIRCLKRVRLHLNNVAINKLTNIFSI